MAQHGTFERRVHTVVVGKYMFDQGCGTVGGVDQVMDTLCM